MTIRNDGRIFVRGRQSAAGNYHVDPRDDRNLWDHLVRTYGLGNFQLVYTGPTTIKIKRAA